MIISETTVRVRFAETDAMGIAYHGNYFAWFEVARVEMLDKLGCPYQEMNKKGYHLPVLEVGANYKHSAFFDDKLTIRALIKERPFVRIQIDYEVMRGNELLCTAHSIHAFVNSKGIPIKPPAEFFNLIRDAFDNSQESKDAK